MSPYDWHMRRGHPYIVRLGEGLRKPKGDVLGVDVAEYVCGAEPNLVPSGGTDLRAGRLDPRRRLHGAAGDP